MKKIFNTAYKNTMRLRLTALCMIGVVAIILMQSCTSQKTEYNIPVSKSAIVNNNKPYKETLQYPFDDKGVDLNVSLSFNEVENILTLSVVGSRQLMVFRQDVFYSTVFRHPVFRARTLAPSKLPYPVLVQPNLKVTLSKNVWKSFNPKRRQHLFNNWLVGVSPELKALTPSITTDGYPEATLIVDSIVQRFSVDPKATKASFTLRNFFVIDKDGMPISTLQQKRNSSKSLNYKVVYEKDLNLTFNVEIQRDPCFGKDSLICAASAKIEDIKKAYTNLREACPDGVVHTTEELGIFNQHRKFLLSQFPCIADSSDCTQLQNEYTKYNAYVDSIKNAPCMYVKPLSGVDVEGDGWSTIGLRASYILDAAHRLDNIVAQMMVSNDAAQIHDLAKSGNTIIATITKAVREKGLINEEQKSAYGIFLKARSYFRSAVLKQ